MKAISFLQNKGMTPLDRSNGRTVADQIATMLLALLPLLQYYRSFFQEAATVTMLVLFVYFGIRLLQTKEWHFMTMLPLLAFSVYELFNHGVGVSELAREALLMAYYVAAASRVIDLKTFSRTVIWIAAIATALIMVQYVCYYLLGFHLQLAVPEWFKENARQWAWLVRTGRISVSGRLMSFYRPSAFFLEPSHFALYCFPSVALALLNGQPLRRKWPLAAFLSLGILLTTSGMGIVMVFGLWGLCLLRLLMGQGTFSEKIKSLVKPRALLLYGIIIAVFLVAYFAVPVFRSSINRIFIPSDSTGRNAIQGRINSGLEALSLLKGSEFFFGKQNWGGVHSWNMSGFFYSIYTQGIIGMLLSYGFYVQCLFRLKDARFWIAAMLLGLSFVTLHTHAAFYMLFYVLILMEGYDEKKDKWVIKNKWSDFFSGLFSKGKRAGAGGE